MTRMWMDRAESGGALAADFPAGEVVGPGWIEVGDASWFGSRSGLLGGLRQAETSVREGKLGVRTNMVLRFWRALAIGDEVLTCETATRAHPVGRSSGEARGLLAELADTPTVEWSRRIPRDDLPVASCSSLGSTLSLLLLAEQTADEVQERRGGSGSGSADREPGLVSKFIGLLLQRITDRIVTRERNCMESLVAALLRSMGCPSGIQARAGGRGCGGIEDKGGALLPLTRVWWPA